MKLTALHLCYNFTAWEQLFTCATTWLHETDSSSPVLHLDCMELTALHLCYNMTAWNWQLFTYATTWLHETDSSSHVLQLDCMKLTALHMCYNLTAWNWQRFTWASPCNWQQGNSARKPATFALSFLFWRVIITLTIMLLLDWYTSAQVRNEKNWKSPLRLFCVSQETNQPTHASHFRWITVKQARPHSLYATLKIVYVRWTNQTSDSKLLSFYINLHVCYPPQK